MIQRIAILSCLVFILFACKKNDDTIVDSVETINPVDTIPIDPNPDTLIIGNNSYVYILQLDSITEAFYGEIQMDIDLNGIADFEITTDYCFSNTSNGITEIFFTCLGSQSFYLEKNIPDTVYVSYDTLSSFNTSNNRTTIEYRQTRSCEMDELGMDSIAEIRSGLYVRPMDLGDTLVISNDSWVVNQSEQKMVGNDAAGAIEIYSSPDTTIFQSWNFNSINCYGFPISEIRYIGIKKIGGGVQKLGWIKVKPLGSKIEVIEIAMQY